MNGMFGDPMLLVAGAGIGVTLLCVFFAFADDKGEKQAKRVARLKSRGQGPGGEALQLRRDTGDKRKIDQLVLRFMPRPELLRERLHRTGYSINLGTYGIACLVVAVVAAVATLIMGFSLLMALPVGLLVGLWLPHLVIGFLATRRANKFGKNFPEAIALMVRGLKSGLPITETFQIVANEVTEPVGSEFRQVSDQIRLGQSPEQALWDAAKRIGTPEMKFLVVTLSIQRETGGNLAETLANLSALLRSRQQLRLKIRAFTSEARATMLIMAGLPFLVGGGLFLVSPDYIGTLFTTETGQIVAACAAGIMGFGIWVMNRIATIKV